MGYKIAIDGPAGAGKGYVAREVSKKLGIINIDTGAMYRAFALYIMKNNIDINDEIKINNVLEKVNIDLLFEKDCCKVILNGEDVSLEIRTEEVATMASQISCIPLVRNHMINLQRQMAENKNVVMEGRDIGSVVLKDADVKIFLTASVEERAKRRYIEYIEKGIECSMEKVIEYIKHRDELDIKKEVSPLIKTKDMIEIDTTNLTKDEVVERIIEIVKDKVTI